MIDIDEWATELICSFHLTDFLQLKPVLHVITTNGTTRCVGLLRVNIGI
jgi:carbohydrate-selective porin OprB